MTVLDSLVALLGRGLQVFLVITLCIHPVFAASDLPALGEASSVNLQEEKDIGAGLYTTLRDHGYVIDEPLLSRYLSDVGESLLATMERRVRDYRFYLVKDGSVNAFAAPGGYIGVNVGLIAMVRSEDELASVLAHEIAHVELRHGMQMLEKSRDVSLASMVSILAAILVSGQSSELAGALIYSGAAGSAQSMVNFTRANEYEADRVGIELLKRSDYDPTRMADFMQLLQSRETTGGLSGIEYIRTHPINSNRVAEVQSRLAGLKPQPSRALRFEQFRDYLAYHYPKLFAMSRASDFALALENLRNGRYTQAEKLLRVLIGEDKDSIWYRYTLAEVLRYQKRDREAQSVYRDLLLLYPDDYAISLRLAEVLVDLNRLDQALEVLQGIEQSHPDETGFYQLLVKVFDALGKEPEKNLARADYHWMTGNTDLATQLYEKLIEQGQLGIASQERIKQRLQENKKSS